MSINFTKLTQGKPVTNGIDFTKLVGGLKLDEKQQPAPEVEGNFHPIKSFTEGWKSHTSADRSFKSAVVEGNMVKEGAQVYADTLTDFNTRNKNTKETFVNYLDGKAGKAELAASIGSSVLGVVNVGFAPIAGALKGAETIPVLGLVASGLNKFAAGLAGTGGNSAVSLLEAIPEGVLDQQTTDKLTPLANEIGGLVGMLVGFKYAGKATGKVSSGITESSYVKPRIEALELKLQQMGEIIRNDPKLGTEVARFVAEHGPARNVPVTSKTPGATDVPVMSPNKKHAAYSKEMGYEPYTPDAKLPVIDAGTGRGGGGAPNSVEIQPSLIGEAKPYTTPKRPTSELLEESRVAPKAETITKLEQVSRPDVVSVNNGTYQLKGKALEDYQQKLETHNKTVEMLKESAKNAKSAGERELYQGRLKAEGMEWSAKLREITGNLTDIEVKNLVKKEQGNYVGKSVQVEINGKSVEGTILSKPAYGNVKVQLKDGTEISAKTNQIKDPRTKEEITEQVTKREESSKYDPTKEEVATKTDEAKQKSSESFKFQDANQEKIVHTIKRPVQVDLMNGGDLFRASTELGEGKSFAKEYFNEKSEKIGRFLDKAIKKEVHPDDSIDVFKTTEPETYKQYVKAWENQPTATALESAIKELNIKMLNGDYVGAKKIHTNLEDIIKNDKAKAEPEWLSDDYNYMLIEMEQAHAGRKNFTTQKNSNDVIVTGERSTFPEWIPEDLRRSTYVQKYQKSRTGMTSDLSITYKEGSPMDRMHKAFIEELQRREETVNARKETQRLEEEGRAAESIEDTSMAEAEYAKLPTDTPNTGTAGKPELMQPVAGTGELRNPTLTQRAVEDLAGQVKTAYVNSELPMHQRANFNEVATKVLDAFTADPKYAMDVAMGREILPPGSDMIQTAFWVEAVNRAKASGDVQGMIDLSRSRVAEFATRAGQEIGYLATLTKGDPVNIIKKLNDSFKEAFEKRTQQSAAETVDVQVATMKRFIKESTLPVEKWLEVIKDIKTC